MLLVLSIKMAGKEDPTLFKPLSFVLSSYITEKEKVEEGRSKLEENKNVTYKRAVKRSLR